MDFANKTDMENGVEKFLFPGVLNRAQCGQTIEYKL